MNLPADESTGIQIGVVYPPKGETEYPNGEVQGAAGVLQSPLQNIDPKSGVGTITYEVSFSNGPGWMAVGMIIYFIERATALTKAEVQSLGTAVSPFNPYLTPYVSKQLGQAKKTYQFGVIVKWEKREYQKPVQYSDDFKQTTTFT